LLGWAHGRVEQFGIERSGGKLWVGSRFMDTVNNGAQAVPYDLAAWDGAAWTIPPAAPKGGWTGFGRVITPGDPF